VAKTYGLYLESGPQHKRTLLHVFDLLGCNVQGSTSEEAVDLAPGAIRAYLRIMARAGEKVDPDAPFNTRVIQHVEGPGSAVGMDSSLFTFDPDLKPTTASDIKSAIARFHAMREILATWASKRTARQLDEKPKSGRNARGIIIHTMGAGYISPLVGTIRGISATVTAAERGDISLADGLRRVDELIAEGLRRSTAEQRRAVIRPEPKRIRTLRKAIRRTLEHDFEHLYELSRRPGGPKL
jgi:predicted RNase H-like HicB family nuclease